MLFEAERRKRATAQVVFRTSSSLTFANFAPRRQTELRGNDEYQPGADAVNLPPWHKRASACTFKEQGDIHRIYGNRKISLLEKKSPHKRGRYKNFITFLQGEAVPFRMPIGLTRAPNPCLATETQGHVSCIHRS